MKISSLLNEAEKPNQGTVSQLPVDKDLIYRAKNKYPGYSSEQAMILLISDEMKNQEKTDSVQNKLIDTQKRENERLRGAVDSLGQELQDFEQQSIETDREVARLKQLSSTLTTGGASAQQQAKISADDLEKLQKDLEILKTKPGMDPEKFKNIELQIKEIANNPSINDDDIKKVNSLINTLNNQKTIGDELYKKLENQLRKTQSDLDKKEGRFSKYIEKKKGEIGSIQQQNAGEIKKYSDIVKSYQQDIEKFNAQVQKLNKDREFINNEKQIMVDLRGEVQQNAEIIQKNADNINKDAKEAEVLLKAIKQLYTKNVKDIDDTPNIKDIDDTPDADDIKRYTSDTERNLAKEPLEEPITAKSKNNVIQLPPSNWSNELYPKGNTIDSKDSDNDNYNDEELGPGYDSRGRPIKTGTNESLLEYENQPFKIYKNWGDPRFNKWMKDNLSMLITLFKNKFREELSNKDPKYSDGQISYSIQEEAWYLKEIFENKEDSILTREKMDSYLTLVKRTLFSQPSNPTLYMQPNNELFNESLGKTYARMLDNIIGLDYIKKG
jgi:hypothetical protein